MSDFFYRQCRIDLPTGNRIRNNAYVTLTGDGGVRLPIEGTSMSDTYDPNGTGRPAPILKEVSIKLEGDAGSLRRIEGGFTCFDVESFTKFENALLVPGRKVQVDYGYVGPETPSETANPAQNEFTIYDYSFKITKENYFDCTFKGVGKGGTYEQNNINTQAKFPAKEFVTNYDGTNDTTKVGNIFDWIDYQLQSSAQPGSVASVIRSRGGTVFAPGHGTSGTLSDQTGNFAFLKAPDEYSSPSKVEGGFFTSYYLQYITLGALCNMLNKYTLDTADGEAPKYRLEFEPNFSKIQTKFPSGLVWSADPVAMLFPYPKGTPENTYDDKAATSVSKINPWSNYISIDHIEKYTPLGKEKADPKDIFISRDLLRAIQQEFNSEAKSEPNKAEESEKATGQIILNRFMKTIFASIRDCSGGAWDLYLDQDDRSPETIFIVNRKSPGGDQQITPKVIDPVGGTNGIREVNISASVPKELQAKAFGGAPDMQSKEEVAVEIIKQDNVSTTREATTAIGVAEQQKNARKGMTQGEYGTSVISKAKSALQALVNEMTANEKAASGQFGSGNDPSQIPFPLKLSLTLDGIEGFQFGDTITTSYLPDRYKTPYGNLKIVFTVTKYEHKISNNDWTTTVEALCRIRKK
tara:strand:- start:4167 stop:6077 length:1911 start_codon:yes stop_codon:yes gene_type:complete